MPRLPKHWRGPWLRADKAAAYLDLGGSAFKRLVACSVVLQAARVDFGRGKLRGCWRYPTQAIDLAAEEARDLEVIA